MDGQIAENNQLPSGWESIGVIGYGSFGVVYRAKRTVGRNTEWAAIKHISMPRSEADLSAICSELGTRDEKTVNDYLNKSVQDMLSEYFRMKQLQGYTNIVSCQDIQQIPKKEGIGYDVYIWMELLESLDNRMIDRKVDRKETIRMGMDICRALSILRSKGIVHRDIKPQNILVNDHGDYKLGDFGSARGIQGTSTILTMKGTLSYTAPEIIMGKPAGFSSDIYSLGLVMYRLMNRNRHPFVQQGDSNVRRCIGEEIPMPVDADMELGRIILKACAYEPRDRWQTPEDMFNALAELGEGTIKDGPNPLPEPLEEPTEEFPEDPPEEPLEDSLELNTHEERNTQRSLSHLFIIVTAFALTVLTILLGVMYLRNEKRYVTGEEKEPPYNLVTGTGVSKISVGSTCFFGAYEQNNDSTDGKEAIEWIVADKQDGSILLISKYALDCQQYDDHGEYGYGYWELSSLRKWLNEIFIEMAFNAEEQDMIHPVALIDDQPSWEDKVFLLSITEAEKYFNSDETRKCILTQYAIAQVNSTHVDSDNYTAWWLRSLGGYQNYAASVYTNGVILTNGYLAKYYSGVRPALWIDLS